MTAPEPETVSARALLDRRESILAALLTEQRRACARRQRRRRAVGAACGTVAIAAVLVLASALGIRGSNPATPVASAPEPRPGGSAVAPGQAIERIAAVAPVPRAEPRGRIERVAPRTPEAIGRLDDNGLLDLLAAHGERTGLAIVDGRAMVVPLGGAAGALPMP